MSSPTGCDLLVIGGGIAGLAAANRAAQLGLAVIVLERGADERYRCNSRYAGGIVHVAYRNVKDPAEELAQAIASGSDGHADPELATALAQTCGRAVDWLREEGAKFIRVGNSAWQQWVLAPPPRVGPGLDWEGRGPDFTLRALADNLARRGGSILRGTAATELLGSANGCSGVQATGANGTTRIAARAVVIADGGFQGNTAMIGRHICPLPEKLKQRGASTGMGDGLRMASALGARITDLSAFYGHTLSRDALVNDTLWPFPHLDDLCTAGIVVDAAGHRFADEGRGGVYLANAIAHLPDPLSAWVIYDAEIWEGPGRVAVTPSNPHLVKAGGTVHGAASLRELAASAALPADALEATVAAYGAALRDANLGALDPPRSTATRQAWPIRTKPFYAAPLCAGITYTFGGIATDADARVLREDGSPIPGLYAAGATTGGLEGGAGCAYVGGLIKSLAFGLRAAEHAARVISR